jgi:hypothetical protein
MKHQKLWHFCLGCMFFIKRNYEVIDKNHKVRTYKEYHSVCPSSELGLPPTPFSPASVPLPPETGERGYTSLRAVLGKVTFESNDY